MFIYLHFVDSYDNVGKYTSPMDPMGNSPWDPWITFSDSKPADLSGRF